MRKVILMVSTLVLALSTSTMLAEDPYSWSGTGDRIPWEESPKYTVYPWSEWWGTLSEGTFAGNWAPDTPNYEGGGTLYRIFSGSILYYYMPEEGGPHTLTAKANGPACTITGHRSAAGSRWSST